MAVSRRNSNFKIGITGNFCAGKSVVRLALQRSGISTFDPELAVIQTLLASPHELTRYIDSQFLGGHRHLSPKKLMNLLYQHPEEKSQFTDALSPRIREEIKRFLYTAIGPPIRAVECTNLLEHDTGHLYDELWMVTAEPEQQIARLMARERLSMGEARYHVDAQWPQEKKTVLCDRVIDNSGNIQQTESQVRKILDEINLQIYKMGL